MQNRRYNFEPHNETKKRLFYKTVGTKLLHKIYCYFKEYSCFGTCNNISGYIVYREAIKYIIAYI
jgi:hypothetical protein